jgi:hypothetical protein
LFDEKDAQIITMLLKEGFSSGNLTQCSTDVTSKMITIDHNSDIISAQSLATFLRDAGFEVSHSGDSSSADGEVAEEDHHAHSHAQGHSHSHSHGHSQSDSKLRNLPEIKRMLEESSDEYIDPWVRTNAISAFTELAKAEAHTHGVDSLEAVHFHEVGAVDSIV